MRLIDADVFMSRMASLYLSQNWDSREVHFSLSDLINNLDNERAIRLEDLLNTDMSKHVEVDIYDEEEIHENCTVQVLRNSLTGVVSIGWWENE